jgi:hypothetical protein
MAAAWRTASSGSSNSCAARVTKARCAGLAPGVVPALPALSRPSAALHRAVFQQPVHGFALAGALGARFIHFRFDSSLCPFHAGNRHKRHEEYLCMPFDRLRANGGRFTRPEREPAGARHGHVEHVEFLALLRAAARRPARHSALGGGLDSLARKMKAAGAGLLRPASPPARPWFRPSAGGCRCRAAARSRPPAPWRRAPSAGARPAHRPGPGARTAPLLQRAHKRVGREVAAPVVLQRGTPAARAGWPAPPGAAGRRGGGKAGQHVAMVVDGVQRIVRRQAVHPALVLKQNLALALANQAQQLTF